MAEIAWEDPPEDGRTNDKHQKIADELRAHPNKWARIATDVSHSYTTRMRRGHVKAYTPLGDFEFVNRGRADGFRRIDVYARYVPQSDKEN